MRCCCSAQAHGFSPDPFGTLAGGAARPVGPRNDKITVASSAAFANRAVAWLGAHSLNATKEQSSPALQRFVADFMAPGDPTHPGDFVLTSDGVRIIHNG